MIERLQKYMASCGIASRRKCEEFIREGKVEVNGIKVKELGFKIDSSIDKVNYLGKEINPEVNKLYIMLNKPTGIISSAKDEKGRKTVVDLVDVTERIYPVGRLDYDTSGLIILTNDGDIYNKLIHPREEIKKVYEGTIKGIVSQDEINKFCNGIDIGGYITSNAEFKLLDVISGNSKVEMAIHEGKNRQIRKMCSSIGHEVITLKRKSIAKITLGSLKEGCWRYLTKSELEYIENL
ncbi:pseudouridine synthase [Haloimpatiens sp. FM7315]|uniref:pseudouridine synthase n=1 Tax=Haloimpatiens sp. FM7315 TaxID=3298609 RepID=UPI0035A2EFB0